MREEAKGSQERYNKAQEQRRAKFRKLSGDLAPLNEKFCVVLDGGKTHVLFFEEHVQQIGRRSHIRRVPTFLSFEDFRNFFCNKTIKYNGKIISVGKWWLEHPGRRQYDGITFQPDGDDVIGNRLMVACRATGAIGLASLPARLQKAASFRLSVNDFRRAPSVRRSRLTTRRSLSGSL